MFDEDVPVLVRHNRVLAYDRAGSGRSTPAHGPVDRVSELGSVATDAFGTQKLFLVGSSYGGQVAVDFALAYPQLVAGLLLIGPGLSGATPSRQRRARLNGMLAAARRGADQLAEAWFSDPHLAPNGFPAGIHDTVNTMLHENINVWLGTTAAGNASCAIRRLHQVRPPGLVVVGEYDDADNQRLAEQLAESAQSIALCRIPRTGHFPQLERPGLLAELIANVSARLAVPQSAGSRAGCVYPDAIAP